MEIKGEKLQLLKSAVMYGIANSRSENETTDFTHLLLDIEEAIASEAEQKKRLEEIASLPGCVFKYCGYTPKCEGKCAHVHTKEEDNG